MEWISVKDRLSVDSVEHDYYAYRYYFYVLVYHKPFIEMAYYENGEWYYAYKKGLKKMRIKPTHWMPIPDPPTVDNSV